MGFSKDKAITEVHVPFSMRTSTGAGSYNFEEVNILHVYRLPTTKERTQYERDLVHLKGRKARTDRSDANFNLFRKVLLYVQGYDDLAFSKEDQLSRPEIRRQIIDYHTDDIGRILVDEGIDRLMDTIHGDDIEWEKKFERSSEESSMTQLKQIPTKMMK